MTNPGGDVGPDGLGRMWAGWRMDYIEGTNDDAQAAVPEPGSKRCPFCVAQEVPDHEALVVARGTHCLTILNLYPYTTAHLMVVPHRHVGDLCDLGADEAAELMTMAQQALAAIRAEYSPEGFNLGANLGKAGGAGIPGHMHLHVLPRWAGDTNFMTSIGATRIMPEHLDRTWSRLHARLSG